MPMIPAAIRRLTPERLRDDVRLRALAVGLGAIPPRRMHSEQDAQVLLEAAHGARVVVEIGVYEGASALLLCRALGDRAQLHLIDPFGQRPDALPSGWGATERATRRVLDRELRRVGPNGPELHWHIALSHEVAERWSTEIDLVFIDGDHSEAGCELDWSCWRQYVGPGGHVVFHDARAGQTRGRGLPGPTAVVDRHFRSAASAPGWEIAAEADRTVAVRRIS
ncbi:MAG TPA: class I SAM-dependent methyltransferase [Solirubrobacteraceae bacterium]